MTNRQNKCFISLAIKALGIKRKFELYATEKGYAKAGKHSNVNNQRSLCAKFSESFNTICNASRRAKPGFFNKFRVEDSVENFIFKSILGFLGGIFLTYICFMFLVFSLNFTLKRATYICMGLGVILSLGLAFSVKIRCTVFLCIPQLFSKRGRQALLAYAFILALSGPAKNTLHNVEVMSESLACTQEQLKQTENELLKCVQKPNAAAKKSIERLLEKINSAVKHFKNFILQLYKNCFDILETVLLAQKWLYSITFLCHKQMGHPAHTCLNLLAEASENCESVSNDVSWKDLCRIDSEIKKKICCTEEKTVCPNAYFILGNLPILQLQEQLDMFRRRATNILYVKIETHKTYSHANRSHTYHEEYQGMATEIRQKTDQFLQYFDFMSVIFGIFILVLFVKVVIYRHKFLTEDHYDNRYITSDFVDIDNTRAAFHMETILPLEPREKMQYIKVTSVRLVPCERIRLLSSFIFLIFATFKIIIHMLTDSSLYWILSSVRREERLLYMSTITEEYPVVAIRVEGDGLVASLFQNVTRAVRKETSFIRMDPTPCLPDPVPPDWNRYYQILALVIICWLLALWEPYGLRLRHTVMVTYHPDRARERAIWLYNRIISNRISFVKMSRRRLRRKYKDISVKDTFRYKFFGRSTPKCLLCGTSADRITCVQCVTPNCPGIYCGPCFSILKFCSICCNPAEYSDPSDLSEERDSSEEEHPIRDNKIVKERWRREEPQKTSRTDSQSLYSFSQFKDIFSCEEIEAVTDFEHWESQEDSFTLTDKNNFGIYDIIPEELIPGKTESVEISNREAEKPAEVSSYEIAGPSGVDHMDKKPMPDFNFNQMYRRRSSSLFADKPPDPAPRLLCAVSSREISKSRLKNSRKSKEAHPKRDTGVLAKLRMPKADFNIFKRKKKTPSPSSSTLEVLSSKSQTSKPQLDNNSSEHSNAKFPFIDPVNIHEFFPESDYPQTSRESVCSRKEKKKKIGARPSFETMMEKTAYPSVEKQSEERISHPPFEAKTEERGRRPSFETMVKDRSKRLSFETKGDKRCRHASIEADVEERSKHLSFETKAEATHSSVETQTEDGGFLLSPEKKTEEKGTLTWVEAKTDEVDKNPTRENREERRKHLWFELKKDRDKHPPAETDKTPPLPKNEDSQSKTKEIWCKETPSSSLSDLYDGQFYSQSYHSSQSFITPNRSSNKIWSGSKVVKDGEKLVYSLELETSKGARLPWTREEPARVFRQDDQNYIEDNCSYVYGIFDADADAVRPSGEESPEFCAFEPSPEANREFHCQCVHQEGELKGKVLSCGCQIFKRMN